LTGRGESSPTVPVGRAQLAAANAELPRTWPISAPSRRTTRCGCCGSRRPLIGGEVTELDFAAMPEWVRLPMLETYVGWCTGRGSTCIHAPAPDRPEPMFAVAWRPGLVACARCIHLTVLRPGSRADRRCDCCGRIVAGIEHAEGIHPGRLQYGALLYGWGACPDCVPDNRAVDRVSQRRR